MVTSQEIKMVCEESNEIMKYTVKKNILCSIAEKKIVYF